MFPLKLEYLLNAQTKQMLLCIATKKQTNSAFILYAEQN